MKIIGYIRVSTTKQKDEGVSLEAQERSLKLYAEVYDLDLIDIEIDVGSAASVKKRPSLKRCLKRLESGEADGVLVAKLDRLTRRVRDVCFMVEDYFQDKTLISVAEKIDTNTPTGRLMLNLLTTFAQWEREMIAQRTSDAMQYLRHEGVKFGRCPYGWEYADKNDENGRRLYRKNEEEQKILAKMHYYRNSMEYSLEKIADKLNESGVPTKRGGQWRKGTINQILRKSKKFADELALVEEGEDGRLTVVGE